MKRLGVAGLMFLTTLMSNVSGVFAYNGNANMSGGAAIVLFVPVMLGIIYLASKSEAK